MSRHEITDIEAYCFLGCLGGGCAGVFLFLIVMGLFLVSLF